MIVRPRNREGTLRQLREEWPVLTLYVPFEQIVAIALSAAIVVVSLVQIIRTVATLLVLDGYPSSEEAFAAGDEP